MAGEARFSREMAAARGLNEDLAQARRDSPDPGRRHDGLAAIFRRRAGRAAATSARPPVSTCDLNVPVRPVKDITFGPKTGRLKLLVQNLTRSA